VSTEIRHVRPEEFERFMRYLERAFGHSKAFFERALPHLYQPAEEALSWSYAIEEEGEIVSHVGLYPIETATAGVRLTVGGIGAVSTSPAARGKGYMSRLLYHVIDEMRRLHYPVSWLGGDRQRYNTFGWELASPVYDLSFSRRSLEWHHVEPAEIEEVLPQEALDTIRRYQPLPACHAVRPHLDQQIHKMDLRFWIADDGYAILAGQDRHEIRIMELVSASGNETGIIRAMLAWNFGDRATWRLSMWDRERLARLMPYANYWSSGNSHMYRINDLTALLTAAQDYLASRAAAIRDFAVALGIREHDRIAVTTLAVEGGQVDIKPGRHANVYLEYSPAAAARLLLGGPPARPDSGEGADLPAGLSALLPVPCYVFPFDHV